jgi:DNA-binding TFAR19-related protein (PDSD5 family)
MTETYSGYKKGELKHAGLSKSRLEELAVLHPELAAEVEKIIAAMKSKGGQVGKPLGAGGKVK